MAASDSASGLYEMVQDKKIDFTLGHYSELVWISKDWKSPHALTTIPFMENEQSEFMASHFGCTKNEWGKKVISEIDRVMEKVVKSGLHEQSILKYQKDPTLFKNWYKKLVVDAK